jgi:hypothetical protein
MVIPLSVTAMISVVHRDLPGLFHEVCPVAPAMNLVRIIEWLRQRLPAVVRVCLVALALLILVDAIPGVVDKEHAHTALERWPGFGRSSVFSGASADPGVEVVWPLRDHEGRGLLR